MEERKQTNSSTIVLTTIGIIALVIVCIGGSYAYFTATATSNEQTITTGTLTTKYTSGQDISATNIVPTEEAGAQLHKFSVQNTGSQPATLKLSLVETSLKKNSADTTSANLKWALYNANESYVEEGSAIATGDFSSVTSTMLLKDSISINASTTEYYILKIWLDEIDAPQNEDQGMTFSTKVQADMQ
ncbi:MAG TPA: hypothetical protein IAB56_04630 [Candidatus Scybalousia intestinigallinarum]|nr:hypothetical protein [Candidatus Scybalousia intestinigallinarum]